MVCPRSGGLTRVSGGSHTAAPDKAGGGCIDIFCDSISIVDSGSSIHTNRRKLADDGGSAFKDSDRINYTLMYCRIQRHHLQYQRHNLKFRWRLGNRLVQKWMEYLRQPHAC